MFLKIEFGDFKIYRNVPVNRGIILKSFLRRDNMKNSPFLDFDLFKVPFYLKI